MSPTDAPSSPPSKPALTGRALATHSRRRHGRGLAFKARAVRDVVLSARESGRWWLVPLVGVLLGTAVLLVAVQVVEYAAPFVYTIF